MEHTEARGKALPRQFAFGDLGCHNDRIFGAVSLQRHIDVNLGTATLWLLARSRPQQMNLWFALSDRGLRMQLGAAFPLDLAGRLVHALLLMPFMTMDLRVPTNGSVVATNTSVHGQGVCTVGFAASRELDAKSREAQHTQLWDNCIGLVVMQRSFTSWRGAFDETGYSASDRCFGWTEPNVKHINSCCKICCHCLRFTLKFDVPLDEASHGLYTKRHSMVP